MTFVATLGQAYIKQNFYVSHISVWYRQLFSAVSDRDHNDRASVLPFQKCVNSVSGFANSVFYRFRFAKFCFLPFQIFKIPFHFFQAVFLLSIIFVFKIVSVSAF